MYKMTKFRLRFILFSHLPPLHNISQNAVILPLSVILPAKDKRRGQKTDSFSSKCRLKYTFIDTAWKTNPSFLQHNLLFLIYFYLSLLKKPFFFGFSCSGYTPVMASSKRRRASFWASFMRSGTCTTRVT